MKKQQKKQAGFIVSAELVLVATILVIGLIVGMVAVRDAVSAELHDVAEAIGSIDQSYHYNGIFDNGINAEVGASAFTDAVDNGGDPGEGMAGAAGDQEAVLFEANDDGAETDTLGAAP